MTLLRQLVRKYQQLQRQRDIDEDIPAETGFDNEDGTYTLKVDGQPNQVYVRLYGDARQTYPAYNFRTGLKSQLPVIVRKNRNGKYKIVDVDEEPATEAFGEAASHYAVPQQSGELLTIIIPGDNLKPGRVRLAELNSLKVYIEAFDYIHNGVPKRWPGDMLDLTSNLPSTSDTCAWVKVGIDPATNTSVAETGDEYPLTMWDILSENELLNILFADKIPLKGVKLYNGQTAITDKRYMADCRPWVWQTQASSGGGGNGAGDKLYLTKKYFNF